ncbi:MAG: NUDIX domain-containing protein [Actinomycetota bacterium]
MPRIVMAMLVDGDRLLLCHRHPGRASYPDVWDLPGGHIEPGESATAALVRELDEELGIRIADDEEPLLGVSFGDVEALVWRIDRWDGEVANRAPHEHDDIGWFRVEELDHLAMSDDEIRRLCRVAVDQSTDEATDPAST